MAKRGRPPEGEYPEKKRVFASRIREDTWAKLRQAAAESGRSVSQEFEHRLRRGLDEDEKIESAFGDLRTYALMKVAAEAVNSLRRIERSKAHWTADADLFDKALEVITETLKIFRPHQLAAHGLTGKPPQLGTHVLEVVQEVYAADPARVLKKTRTKRERAMLRLKDQLGELADRAIGQVSDNNTLQRTRKKRKI